LIRKGTTREALISSDTREVLNRNGLKKVTLSLKNSDMMDLGTTKSTHGIRLRKFGYLVTGLLSAKTIETTTKN